MDHLLESLYLSLIYGAIVWCFCIIIRINFLCVFRVFLLDYIKSYLSVAHYTIIWFYYHLLLSKNSFILTKANFSFLRCFSNKREASAKKKSGISENFLFTVDFDFRYFLTNFSFSPNDSPSKTMKDVFYFI